MGQLLGMHAQFGNGGRLPALGFQQRADVEHAVRRLALRIDEGAIRPGEQAQTQRIALNLP